jgi:TonB family protein
MDTMRPRVQITVPLFVRTLLAISACCALTFGSAPTARAHEHASEKTQAETKPQAQQPPADVQELANRLAPNLARTHSIRVLVLDFKGPHNLWLPFSAWLGDQVSAAIGNVGKQVEVVPRSKLTATIADRRLEPKDEFDIKIAESLAESLKAQVIISGSYVATQSGLGVALRYGEKEGDSWLVQAWREDLREKISLPSEVSNSLGITLESLRPKDGIYQGGEGGVSYPMCIRCPPPRLPNASIGKTQGTVMMLATITPEGRAAKIKVTKGAGFGLDAQAVKAVEAWEFTPAKDVDGKPVPVRTPIEVVFRIY